MATELDWPWYDNGKGAWVSNGVVQTMQSNPNQETYQVADASDNAWSFGGSTNNGNNISSTETAGTGYNGIKLLTDEEAYQKILEVKKEHPEGTKEPDCPTMVEWVNEALYGNAHIYLPGKEFDWDDLHVGDEIWYANAETTSHRVMEFCHFFKGKAFGLWEIFFIGRNIHRGTSQNNDSLIITETSECH